MVTLKSESSYIREGKLMSHCVGSYYGRDKIIYSLRDSKNNPHCTIEHGQQIKGKGN
ncbi:PcfJ domain-containing protein [uncultured Flavobacterium sp.]|uniref:PcfJ domain-containing protein n=1 Tax=uncultured Flavobacterium sp. TaxID=165435 RepID=UPI00338EADB8